MLSFELMDARLLKQIAKLNPAIGLTVSDIANDQMRLWLQSLVSLTPPSKRLFGSALPSTLRGKGEIAMGKRAVQGDLMELFHGVMASTKGTDIGDGIVRVESTDGAVWAADSKDWQPGATMADLARHHKGNRNRNNRVRNMGRRTTKHVTGLTRVGRMHVKRSTLRKYIRSVQDRVGTLKAGWMVGLEHYSMMARKGFSRPAWARKLQWRGSTGGRISATGNGHIDATNLIPHMRDKMQDSAIAATERIRKLDIQKHLTTRINQVAKRFSEGQP